MTPVTDPSVLAQLNGSAQALPQVLKPVTDPSVLAQLNAEPRTSESIGGFVGSEAGKAMSLAFPEGDEEEVTKAGENLGKGIGLSADSMLQAIKQYTVIANGTDEKKKRVQDAQDIQKRQGQLPGWAQVGGELATAALPMGAAGKAATGPEAVTKIEKMIQALKTVATGGAVTAATTPVTDEKADFSSEKASQFGAGAAGTAVLGAGASGVKGIYNMGKSVMGPVERAATVQKLVDSLGFKASDLSKVSDEAAKTVADTEKAGANAVNQPTSLGKVKTTEELGEKARVPIESRQKELEAMRSLITEPIAAEARQSTRHIPTQPVIKMLQNHSQLSKETAEGRAIYDNVMRELTGYDAPPVKGQLFHAIPSSKYEAARAHIKELIERGYKGNPLDERRAKVLQDAVTELDKQAAKAVPKWGEFLDKYKKNSVPLDAFKRQEGAQIGKITVTDKISGAHEMPPEKVVDHIIDGGVTRVRAAIKASGNAPEVKQAVEHRLWQRLSEMNENGKMTPSAMDTFMKEHAPILKELGVHDKFEVARNQLKAADAIGKTAIAKIAKSFGNPADAFNTLGSILKSADGQRMAGLKELSSMTKGDPDAREALRYGIVMHMVSASENSTLLARQAIMTDLEKSGLFSSGDIGNIKTINEKFDQLMKIGPNPHPKTVMEYVLGKTLNLAGRVGPLRAAGKVASAVANNAMDTANYKAAKINLSMAASDPKYAKLLLSTPTDKTIKEGLTAMQRAGIYMTVNQAMK